MLRHVATSCCGPAAKTKPSSEVLRPCLIKKPEDLLPPVEQESVDSLVERHDLMLAPPGAETSDALVSSDFPKNCLRLLVLIPSANSSAGSWDTSAGSHGLAGPVIQWAQANGYAVCLFLSSALKAGPAEAWERVMKGSPAGTVFTLAARGTLSTFAEALAPVHPLLFSRFRLAIEPFGSEDTLPPTWPVNLEKELLEHLDGIVLRVPEPLLQKEPKDAVTMLFEKLERIFIRFQQHEAKKYIGFQGLKENDVPGFKRLSADERISRLDRDRQNDELARLLRQNCRPNDSEVPDID